MLIQKRNSLPYKLLGLQALARRLSREDLLKARITEEIRIVQAGVNGEKILANIFEKYKFRQLHYIFHDLSLKSSGLFQMDALFLAQQGAVILEVKNIAGRIRFPSGQNQLMRTLENGKVDFFECPSVQLLRNKMLLEDWFYANNLQVPIYGAVIFPKPQQQFENSRDQLKVLFPLEVPVYLKNLMENPHILNLSTLDFIAEKLTSSHREYDPFPLCEKYKIDFKQIKTGVRCDQCGLHGMISIARGWICKSCNYVSKDAYRQAIIEYFMLFGGPMTNRICREFLHLSSSDKAMRLMKKMNLPFHGMNRGRTYHLPLKELETQLRLLTMN